MTASSTLPAPNLMPLMRYRDLAEAMGWLEQAFGFEKQIAVSDSDGAVIYGQMIYRGSLLMMGAVRDTDLDKLMRQPDEVGGIETQSCYLVVEDADAHYAHAQESGAEIVLELKSDGLGRRGYSCRDPQGHIWNFGTYNPAKGLTLTAAPQADEVASPSKAPRRSRRMLMSLAGLLLALGGTCWAFGDKIQADLSHRIADAAGQRSAQDAERAYAELVRVRGEKRKAEEAAALSAKALEGERQRRIALEARSGSSGDKLTEAEGARHAAEAAVATLREELRRKQEALDAAIEAKRVSEEKLAVKSASAEPKAQASPPVALAAEDKGSKQARNNEIETSATQPASDDDSVRAAAKAGAADGKDGKDEARAPQSSQSKTARPARTTQKSKGSAGSGRRGYPEYAVEVGHVWPYSGWSKRTTSPQ